MNSPFQLKSVYLKIINFNLGWKQVKIKRVRQSEFSQFLINQMLFCFFGITFFLKLNRKMMKYERKLPPFSLEEQAASIK